MIGIRQLAIFSSLILFFSIFTAPRCYYCEFFDSFNTPQFTRQSHTKKPININTADIATLTQLPGIGLSKAENITAFRKSVGRINDIEQILNVPGITPELLAKLSTALVILENEDKASSHE